MTNLANSNNTQILGGSIMLRKKLSVTILVAVCSVLAFLIGLMAASTASVGVNGSVKYTALGNVKATISLSHTASNDVYAVTEDGEGSAVGGQVATITFAGTEKKASGSFNLTGTADGTVLVLNSVENATQVLYSYTLKVANNYTSQDTGAKKNLKVTFTPPVENNAVSTTLQSGYSWNNNSTILNVGASVEIVVTFLVNDLDNSLEANLASNITLEATGDSGQDFSPVILTLNAAGGDLANSTANVYHGTTYGELPTPIRADHTFLGWYTGENGTGTKITSTTTVDKANTTLYAHWVINSRTVTFDYNDGTSSTANDVTINVNYNTTIPAGDIPTQMQRDGYDFLGWFTDSNHQTPFNFETPIVENMTIYAGWAKHVKIYLQNITAGAQYLDSLTIKIYKADEERIADIRRADSYGEHYISEDNQELVATANSVSVNTTNETYSFNNLQLTLSNPITTEHFYIFEFNTRDKNLPDGFWAPVAIQASLVSGMTEKYVGYTGNGFSPSDYWYRLGGFISDEGNLYISFSLDYGPSPW